MAFVKICGLRTPADVDAVAEAGANAAGFVIAPGSPRTLTIEAALTLAHHAAGAGAGLEPWFVAVRPSIGDAEALREAPQSAVLQLHGGETVGDAHALHDAASLPLARAAGVAGRSDLDALTANSWGAMAPWLLLDAKPPKNAARTGGHGVAFDWGVLHGWTSPTPWLLSGGLNAQIVGAGVGAARPHGVDVSSGVESAPGVKDPAKIKDFVAAARAAFAVLEETAP